MLKMEIKGVFSPVLARYIFSFSIVFFKKVAANAHHRCGPVNLRSKQSRFYLYLWSVHTSIALRCDECRYIDYFLSQLKSPSPHFKLKCIQLYCDIAMQWYCNHCVLSAVQQRNTARCQYDLTLGFIADPLIIPFLCHCGIEKGTKAATICTIFYPTMCQKNVINWSAIKFIAA